MITIGGNAIGFLQTGRDERAPAVADEVDFSGEITPEAGIPIENHDISFGAHQGRPPQLLSGVDGHETLQTKRFTPADPLPQTETPAHLIATHAAKENTGTGHPALLAGNLHAGSTAPIVETVSAPAAAQPADHPAIGGAAAESTLHSIAGIVLHPALALPDGQAGAFRLPTPEHAPEARQGDPHLTDPDPVRKSVQANPADSDLPRPATTLTAAEFDQTEIGQQADFDGRSPYSTMKSDAPQGLADRQIATHTSGQTAKDPPVPRLPDDKAAPHSARPASDDVSRMVASQTIHPGMSNGDNTPLTPRHAPQDIATPKQDSIPTMQHVRAGTQIQNASSGFPDRTTADSPVPAMGLRPGAPSTGVKRDTMTFPEVSLSAGGDAGPTRSLPLSPQVYSPPEISRQITDTILQARSGGQDTELVLSPEELGRLRFSISNDESGIVITITAERPETLTLIKRNIELLTHDLKQSGMGEATLSFGESGKDPEQKGMQGRDPAPPAQAKQKTDETATPAAPHRGRPSGRLDIRV
ncbi:MAG: flagellar hook-length control protein FliK [Paracoccus sp. (in: a-proteobacteria)]|nr:flagellar hook-length control protein FliK [Paracoccus sp. (in: a-proteobacteria)]